MCEKSNNSTVRGVRLQADRLLNGVEPVWRVEPIRLKPEATYGCDFFTGRKPRTSLRRSRRWVFLHELIRVSPGKIDRRGADLVHRLGEQPMHGLGPVGGHHAVC